ncbi:MAG: hypothetical protein Q9220_001797 [cf. Caloplaca sp. 1 TL-2023]
MFEKVPVVIVQILTALLSTQKEDDSWMPAQEFDKTAYATAYLLDIIDLPYTHNLSIEIQCAIAKACAALALKQDKASSLDSAPDKETNNDPSGTLKILSYALQMLSLTNHTGSPDKNLGTDTAETFTMHHQKTREHIEYLSALSQLKRVPYTRLKCSIVEANLYRPILQRSRTGILPPLCAGERHEYLANLPIMWLLATASYNVIAPPELLIDMMSFSTWVYMADEYFKSKVTAFPKLELKAFREHVEDDFQERPAEGPCQVEEEFEELYVAPPISNLVHDAISFLGSSTLFLDKGHTNASGDNSGSLSWAFFACLIGGSIRSGCDCMPTPKHKLMAHNMVTHHSAFYWLCKEYDSPKVQDSEWSNPSFFDFPEFSSTIDDDGNNNGITVAGPEWKTAEAKLNLLDAARFERQCASDAAEILYDELEAEKGVGGDTMADRIRVFVGAGEQFADSWLAE